MENAYFTWKLKCVLFALTTFFSNSIFLKAGQSQTQAHFCADCIEVSVPGGVELKGQTSGFRRVAAALPVEEKRTPAAEETRALTSGDVFIIAPAFENRQRVGMGFYIREGGACYLVTNAHIFQKGNSTEFFKSGIKASLTVGKNEQPWPLEMVGIATEFLEAGDQREMRDFALLYDSRCKGAEIGEYVLGSYSAGMLLSRAGKVDDTNREKFRATRFLNKGNSDVIDTVGIATRITGVAGPTRELVLISTPVLPGESGSPVYQEVGKGPTRRRIALAVKTMQRGDSTQQNIAIPTEFIHASVMEWLKAHQASLNNGPIRQAGAGDAADPTAAKKPN